MRRRASTLDELLHDEDAYGEIEVRPGVTVCYDAAQSDFWPVTIDGESRVTDMHEDVARWLDHGFN